MTNAQFTARKLLKKHQEHLTSHQIKTLNGLIKAGNIEGALNGLHTILAREIAGRKEGAYGKTKKRDRSKAVREPVCSPVHNR